MIYFAPVLSCSPLLGSSFIEAFDLFLNCRTRTAKQIMQVKLIRCLKQIIKLKQLLEHFKLNTSFVPIQTNPIKLTYACFCMHYHIDTINKH